MFLDFLRHVNEFLIEFFKKEEIWIFLLFVALGGGVLLFLPIDFAVLLKTILGLFRATWWLWFFLFFFPIFRMLLLYVRQELFKQTLQFTLLELKLPREIPKSPQAMEQVLVTLSTLRGAPGNLKEKYWDGQIPNWYSFEMVSFGGEVHFYVGTQEKYRDIVEAAFFSYYPDVEIVAVRDYLESFPLNLRELSERKLKGWGVEMTLAREDMYPIKTYTAFENPQEEKQFDPISAFLEVLGKAKSGETAVIQILASPAPSNWKDQWEDALGKLRQPAILEVGGGEEGEKKSLPISRSPGQMDVLEAVEENLSKPAFKTLIRLFYLAPEEEFRSGYPSGLVGIFNQYASFDLNAFRPNSGTVPRATSWAWPYLFPTRRAGSRLNQLLFALRRRVLPSQSLSGRIIRSLFFGTNFFSKTFFLNVEGFATLFHPPTAIVLTAPHVKRVVSRKTGPPAGLAIFGEEREIEKFK